MAVAPTEFVVGGVPPDSGENVETYGWDTVFAIPVPQVNKAIAEGRSSPEDFTGTLGEITVTGRFGDWRLTGGGDGKNLNLSLPLKDVVLTNTTSGAVSRYDNGEALVELMLNFVPHEAYAAPRPNGTVPHLLVVKDTPEAGADDIGPPVSVLEVTLNPRPGFVSRSVIKAALGDWLRAHLGRFSHVFAVVDLNTRIDTGPWAFIRPRYASYAYLDRGDAVRSTFAVLCTTEDRTGQGLSEQLAHNAIPEGHTAGFLLATGRVLADLVRPATRLAYPGLTNDDFRLSDDGSELYLTQGTVVNLPSVDHGGETFDPKLTRLTIRAVGQTLTLNSRTETEVAPGITSNCESTHWYTLGLATSANGQTITFEETRPPSVVHDIGRTSGSVLAQEIVLLAATIALLVLTVLTDGMVLLVGGLVLGLLIGADELVPELIEAVNTDASPSIDLLLTNAVAPIAWTGGSAFHLESAALHGALQLGGDPRFTHSGDQGFATATRAPRTRTPDRAFTTAPGSGLQLNLKRADPGAFPTPDNHPLLALAKDADPAGTRRITAGIAELVGHQDELFAWLAADDDNAALFRNAPVAAVRQALPDLPGEFVDDLLALARELLLPALEEEAGRDGETLPEA